MYQKQVNQTIIYLFIINNYFVEDQYVINED